MKKIGVKVTETKIKFIKNLFKYYAFSILIFFISFSFFYAKKYNTDYFAVYKPFVTFLIKFSDGLPCSTKRFFQYFFKNEKCYWLYDTDNKFKKISSIEFHKIFNKKENINLYIKAWLENWKYPFLWAVLTSILYIILITIFFKKKGKEVTEEQFLRGRIVFDNPKKADKKYRKKIYIPLSKNLGLRRDFDIFRHILILGAPGTGKTTLLNQIIDKIQDKKMVIFDYKGDFLSKWFNKEKDIIFNPYDVRNVGWTLTNDLTKLYELQNFIETCIEETKERFWSDAARQVLAGILISCMARGELKNLQIAERISMTTKDIVKFLNETLEKGYVKRSIEVSEIRKALQVLENEKTAQSVVSVLGASGRFLSLLDDGNFSFKKWVRSEGNSKIFIANGPKQEGLKSLFTTVINLIANEVLSLPDISNFQERIYFVIDEWGTLDRMEAIRKLITLGRSKGCCMILANQDLARIHNVYEKELETLVANVGSLVSLKIEGEFSQNYLSRTFGEYEIEKAKENYMLGEMRDSINITRQIEKRTAVLASELGSLKPFQCFVRLPDGVIARDEIEKKFYHAVLNEEELFIEKETLKLKIKTETEEKELKKEPKEIIIEKEEKNKNEFDF